MQCISGRIERRRSAATKALSQNYAAMSPLRELGVADLRGTPANALHCNMPYKVHTNALSTVMH